MLQTHLIGGGHIQHGIDAIWAKRAHGTDQVALGIVKGLCRSQGSDVARRVWVCGRQHAGSALCRELDGVGPNAAGGPHDQDHRAGTDVQRVHADQRNLRRHGQSGSLYIIERDGFGGHGPGGGGDHIVGIGAPVEHTRHELAEDIIPESERGHA